MNLDPCLSPYTKTNSKWIQDINVRAKTIKLFEESTGDNLHDIEFDDDFLHMTKNAQAMREKIVKLNLVKIKNFVC